MLGFNMPQNFHLAYFGQKFGLISNLSHVTDQSWLIALFGLSTFVVTCYTPMASGQNSTVVVKSHAI
jgi:hypothetical protein